MLSVDFKTLHVPLEEHEFEQIRVAAEAAGRSPQEYAHDTLVGAVSARARRHREVLVRVQRISDALNQRLAQ
ncbi:MAG TPA: hypothetical protein VMV92_06235 [Streptosporangiaceae bacterium]|nr:hypothetical protein [Streptosporangiaceae bacterium]